MTDENLETEIASLKEAYGDVGVAKASGGQPLIRVKKAALPKGCSPSATAVLLAINPGQPRPQLYVKPGIKLPNGKVPRSTSAVAVEGEAWMQFSYSFPWDENSHSLVQLVGASLQRFAKTE
jgi:hypothetical protein